MEVIVLVREVVCIHQFQKLKIQKTLCKKQLTIVNRGYLFVMGILKTRKQINKLGGSEIQG